MSRQGAGSAEAEDDADPQSARDRYRELLEEFRVVIPGVQVLFAFLLTAPFSARFGEIDHLGKVIYLVALVSTALAMTLFMSRATYHRLGPRNDPRARLRLGERLAVAAMALLALAVTSALFVVVRFVLRAGSGLAIAVGVGTAMLLVWYVLPLARRKP